MKVAKAKGHLRGTQPKLNHRQEAHLVALLNGGESSTGELADLFGSPAPPSTEQWIESEPATSSTSAPVSAESFFALSRRHTPAGQQRPPDVEDLRTPLDVR